MIRLMGGEGAPFLHSSGTVPIDGKILSELGLSSLIGAPSDPGQLAEFLIAEDHADAELDLDEFSRGIRRAVRLGVAFSAKLHRRSGKRWTTWVAEQFKAGYACYHRYFIAAQLQIGLVARGLPRLANENQSRALSPFRKHEKFWEVLSGEPFRGGFPPGPELRRRMLEVLLLKTAAASTPRIQLHRALERIVCATPANDDPVVIRALAVIAHAVTILEHGRVGT